MSEQRQSLLIEDGDVPPTQERVTGFPADCNRGNLDEWACGRCFYSRAAVGSLGGIWLFCDHPESFKRYVKPDARCECFAPLPPAPIVETPPHTDWPPFTIILKGDGAPATIITSECCHRALRIDNPGDYCSGVCADRHEQGLCACQEQVRE